MDTDADENSKLAREGPRLNRDESHIGQCHHRWMKGMTRPGAEDGNYPDAWCSQQCGGRRFYIKLTGDFRYDWGVCTNVASPRDGRATFEHDGCDHFAACETGCS